MPQSRDVAELALTLGVFRAQAVILGCPSLLPLRPKGLEGRRLLSLKEYK